MVSESWFRNLLKTSRKREANQQKALVGVLAFEVASLMSKLIHLWRFLGDKQIIKLREAISNSVGIKNLVSDDEEYIVRLICAELEENVIRIAKSVARLGRKCSDPGLKSFEHVFSDLIRNGAAPYGWIFSWKKMERKVKKMDRFVSINATLYQETETLSDLERTVRRMKGNEAFYGADLIEFQKKAAKKRADLKNLCEHSLWNRTYDYTVFLLARSLFTVFSRIKHVFGFEQMVDSGGRNYSSTQNYDQIRGSQSVSTLMQSLLHPTKNGLARFASGPLRRIRVKSGRFSQVSEINTFYSGSLAGSVTVSGPLARHNSGKDQNFNVYSDPLKKPGAKSSLISETEKNSKKLWLSGVLSLHGNSKKPHQKPNGLTQVEPLRGHTISPIGGRHLNFNGFHSGILDGARDSSSEPADPQGGVDVIETSLNFRCRLLDAPPETLGATALSLHYANVVVVIEKLAASPHLIGLDARDDLYNMLPATIRTSLRARLRPFSNGLTSSIYDTVLAAEWSKAMTGILEWLSPLAHNTIRWHSWQSERSFEQQNTLERTNVLLVQTLYFANQEKMETTITELLVGLTYVWRLGRELDAKSLFECSAISSRIFDEYFDIDGRTQFPATDISRQISGRSLEQVRSLVKRLCMRRHVLQQGNDTRRINVVDVNL